MSFGTEHLHRKISDLKKQLADKEMVFKWQLKEYEAKFAEVNTILGQLDKYLEMNDYLDRGTLQIASKRLRVATQAEGEQK